jgi:hypothetical protein
MAKTAMCRTIGRPPIEDRHGMDVGERISIKEKLSNSSTAAPAAVARVDRIADRPYLARLPKS